LTLTAAAERAVGRLQESYVRAQRQASEKSEGRLPPLHFSAAQRGSRQGDRAPLLLPRSDSLESTPCSEQNRGCGMTSSSGSWFKNESRMGHVALQPHPPFGPLSVEPHDLCGFGLTKEIFGRMLLLHRACGLTALILIVISVPPASPFGVPLLGVSPLRSRPGQCDHASHGSRTLMVMPSARSEPGDGEVFLMKWQLVQDTFHARAEAAFRAACEKWPRYGARSCLPCPGPLHHRARNRLLLSNTREPCSAELAGGPAEPPCRCSAHGAPPDSRSDTPQQRNGERVGAHTKRCGCA
jgi:hypothetical protein